MGTVNLKGLCAPSAKLTCVAPSVHTIACQGISVPKVCINCAGWSASEASVLYSLLRG